MLKRGNIVTDNTVGLFISIGVVGVLVLFLFLVISSDVDMVDEISGSYSGMLEDAVKVADAKGVGEFYMIDMGEVEEEVDFYLIYFGNENSFEYDGKNFVKSGLRGNMLCVCNFMKDLGGRCLDCMNLEVPAYFEKGDVRLGDQWGFSQGERLTVSKEEGRYVFESFE